MQLSRMIQSALETCNVPESIEFIVYADSDDVSMENFSQSNTRIIFGPKMSISRMTNTCYKNATGVSLNKAGGQDEMSLYAVPMVRASTVQVLSFQIFVV